MLDVELLEQQKFSDNKMVRTFTPRYLGKAYLASGLQKRDGSSRTPALAWLHSSTFPKPRPIGNKSGNGPCVASKSAEE